MRALSIRQPFAELILAGRKTVEYRTRPTRVIGERFWIYASRRPAVGSGGRPPRGAPTLARAAPAAGVVHSRLKASGERDRQAARPVRSAPYFFRNRNMRSRGSISFALQVAPCAWH